MWKKVIYFFSTVICSNRYYFVEGIVKEISLCCYEDIVQTFESITGGFVTTLKKARSRCEDEYEKRKTESNVQQLHARVTKPSNSSGRSSNKVSCLNKTHSQTRCPP